MAFLGVYLVGIIGFIAGSEFLVRFVVAPNDSYETYKAMFRTVRAPIAAFGDSHVANGLSTGKILVNFGYAGETLPLMLVKARAYVESGRGRRVILQYSPEQYAIYRVNNQQPGVADELLGRNESWLMFMRPHYRGYLLAYWKSAFREPQRIAAVFAKAQPKTKSGGRADEPDFSKLPIAAQRRAAELRVQLQAPLPPGPTVRDLLTQFVDTIRDFKKAGVDVCVVEFPLSSAYRTAAARVRTYAGMHKRVSQLMAQLSVTFLDLSAAMPEEAFSDPDHVGARARGALGQMVTGGCFGESASVPAQ